MQPHSAQSGWRDLQMLELAENQFGDHWHNFLEDLSAFLDKQLVTIITAFGVHPVEEAEIVADIIGKLRLEPRAQYVPIPGGCHAFLFDKDGGGDIAKNEMTVPIAPVQMTRTDFRIDDKDRSGIA